MWVYVPMRPEEGVRSLVDGFTSRCEPLEGSDRNQIPVTASTVSTLLSHRSSPGVTLSMNI